MQVQDITIRYTLPVQQITHKSLVMKLENTEKEMKKTMYT